MGRKNESNSIGYRLQESCEADFWEGGYAVPLFAGLAAGFLVFLALMSIAQKFSKKWQGPSNLTTGAAAIASLCAAGLVFKYLFI